MNGFQIALIGCAASLVVGFGAGWKVHDWADASAKLQAVEHVTAVVQKQDAAAQTAAVKDQAHQDQVRTVTKTITQEVPVYVTAQTDARFPVPWGFVRLHDEAARGVSASPADPGRPDDAASDVTASEAASVVVTNYGACNAAIQRLTDLQALLRTDGLAK